MDVKEQYERLTEDAGIDGRDAAVLVLAAAVGDVAHQLCMLGNAGTTNMKGTAFGGLEALGMVHKEGMERFAGAIDGLAQEVAMLNEP